MNATQTAMQACADACDATASALDSVGSPVNEITPQAWAGMAMHIASGAFQVAADALGPAQLQLQQAEDISALSAGNEITDIQNAQDLKEVAMQFAQDQLQVALALSEAAHAVNTQVTDLQQISSLINAWQSDQVTQAVDELAILSNPAFRIQLSQEAKAADASLVQAKQDLYLAVRGLEYETNTDLSNLANGVFLAPTGAQLNRLDQCLANDWNAWLGNVSSTNTYVTEISLAKDVLGITGPVTDAQTGEVIDEGTQFRHQLFAQPYANDALHSWPALRFGTTAEQSGGVFSSLVCNDRIQGVEVKLVGANLAATHAEVKLLANGTGQLRSCLNSDDLVTWNLRPSGQPAPAVVQAGVNTYLTGTPPNTSLYDFSVSQDQILLTVPDGASDPVNQGLDPTQIDDIVLRVTHTAVAGGSSTSNFPPQCNALLDE